MLLLPIGSLLGSFFCMAQVGMSEAYSRGLSVFELQLFLDKPTTTKANRETKRQKYIVVVVVVGLLFIYYIFFFNFN